MGSNYFGELNLGNERSSSSSSGSSRKSKKNNSEKTNKQPQRGLGVAQLEKIRLHSEMGCANNYLPSLHNNNPYANNLTQEDMRLQTAYSSSSSFSYSTSSSAYGFPNNQGIMMGMSGIEGANIRYGDSQPSSRPSTWHPGTVYEPQHYAQPNMTRHLHTMQVEDSMERRRKKDRSDSIGSSNSEELDLELRLSL